MTGHLRAWVLIGLIGLMVIGVALIAVAQLTPNVYPSDLTPIPTALIIEQSNLPYPDVPRIKVEDARAAAERRQAIIVDARSATQYAHSHIPGAKSIPVNELENRLSELNKDQLIITYCT